MADTDLCSNNSLKLKDGLIFLKTKTDDAECVQEFIKSGSFPSFKQDDKWIVVAGNSYSLINEFQVHKKSSPDFYENDNKSKQTDQLRDISFTAGKHILNQPLFQLNIVEMHLDSVFKEKSTLLPSELFNCVNVRVLSLRRNNIVRLPADIGRLSHLRTLILTENCLMINTIPFTLTFCRELRELYLDHNLLDALPGFLLDMKQLHTVYRHGNLNYFKSTFMWYHTAQRDRVMPVKVTNQNRKSEGFYEPESLEDCAIRALIASKINFFTPGLLPVLLQNYVARVYPKYNICAKCGAAYNVNKGGCRVFTFKNPYLGNSCVPFEHWTCSRACGVALEEPAQRWEHAQSHKFEQLYQQFYIKSVQEPMCQKTSHKVPSMCVLM